MFRALITFSIVILFMSSCSEKSQNQKQVSSSKENTSFQEKYRPQFHFSPEEKWMNDPNGLVYHQGIYHLFYQYYPDDIVWGPMHWGHAVSKDMIYWEHKEIALYPDEHGLIFSGSAVLDKDNSSGFGSKETPPLVAIYTYHLLEGEEAGRDDFQTQGIAYSLDNGNSWTKYAENPVIKNVGIKDFRDPKVFWHEETQKWIMVLVAGDHARIYNSDNLKDWNYLSDFGQSQGAHGGVWECPDLFKLKVGDTQEERWVLLISINPGAPNGGSGTQYFIGDFDGEKFTSDQKDTKWIDFGTDNYAGVTYNNTPNDERIFIGWMSNWNYARNTPTEVWRSAMTLPRKLSLAKIEDDYFLLNPPIKQVDKLIEKDILIEALSISNDSLFSDINFNASEIRFITSSRQFNMSFSNQLNDELILSMNADKGIFKIDRSHSGNVDFEDSFKNDSSMPVTNLPEGEAFEVRILMDWSSIEVFIGNGQYVMTQQIFPKSPYENFKIENTNSEINQIVLNDFQINGISRIW